eukprot:jgi/Hompol1/6879/HPOL_002994-RA
MPAFMRNPVILERRPAASADTTASDLTALAATAVGADAGANVDRSAAFGASNERLRKLFGDSTAPTQAATVKLIDDHMRFVSDQPYRLLSDHPGCFIVGVLGRRGVGKSTVLSAFSRSSPFAVARSPPQPHPSKSLHVGETRGIDLHVTPERTVLLDTQPILCVPVAERLKNATDFFGDAAQSMRSETLSQIESIKMTMFMMSVCHVIILVSDAPFDTELWKHVRRAESARNKLFCSTKPEASSQQERVATGTPSVSSSAQSTPLPGRSVHTRGISSSSISNGTQSTPADSAQAQLNAHQPMLVYAVNKSKPFNSFSPQSQAHLHRSFAKAFDGSELDFRNLFSNSHTSQSIKAYTKAFLKLKSAEGSAKSSNPEDQSSYDNDDLLSTSYNVVNLPLHQHPHQSSDNGSDSRDVLDELLLSSEGCYAQSDVALKQLRDTILGIPRYPLAQMDASGVVRTITSRRQFMVSERDWMRSAGRIWDAIRKTDIPSEFLTVPATHKSSSSSSKTRR